MVSCQKQSEPVAEKNPLLEEFNTPFGVPPFTEIKDEHFSPAFDEAYKQQNAEIEAIINNPEEPTFENTVVAYVESGSLLTRVSRVFFNLNGADTNPVRQALATEISPKSTVHSDNISMNPALFARIQAVYDKKDELNLEGEDLRLLEETYKSFVRSGAALAPEAQEQLKAINKELSTLTVKFGQNVLADVNEFKMLIENPEDLAGLPEGVRQAAKEAALAQNMVGWLFTLHNPSALPFLQYSENRELREKLERAYINKGDNNNANDNKDIVKKIVELRINRAKLLGSNNHAEFVLANNMAKNPQNVYDLLNRLWTPTIAMAKNDAVELQAMIDAEGGDFKLAAWDWRFYAEKLRKQKYDLDEEELRPYFELNNVKQGIFDVCFKLWGINFNQRIDIPVYHPDVTAYEVIDKDGSHIGIFYMDFHPRESKRGGAWMTSFREQSIKDGEFIHPVVSIVCNFTKPTSEQPSLLTFDEVTTFFHEFGHALHGLFSDCKYESLSGTSVSRDFVELPSQIMELWCYEPEALSLFAKHYVTEKVIPDELVEKIINSSHFNQGFLTGEFLAAAFLDMDYHTLNEYPADFDIYEFEAKTQAKLGLIDEVVYRYRSTYFNHIFSGGYSAGYYSYIWSGVLDADAFEKFRETGIFNQETADSFRYNILSRGNTEDPMTLYVRFRGAEPSVEPLLGRRGLK